MDWLQEATRVMLLAPHPDDESIGAGGHFHNWPDAWIGLITDGTPRDPKFAYRSGFETREAYAAARRREFEAAIAVARVPLERTFSFNYTDQESALDLPGLTDRLQDAFSRVQPEVVLVPPYEGGHPDHDSTAFAAHTAAGRMNSSGAPRLIEYALYNNGGGEYSTGKFLDDYAEPVETIELASGPLSTKQAMYACYPSQREVLNRFDPRRERFRPAPAYDFTQPPHPGPQYYDRYNWPITSSKWRALAREILK